MRILQWSFLWLTVLAFFSSKQNYPLMHPLVEVLFEVMDGVSDIPRHYRWTKKPHPTEASLYISEAFSVFESFTVIIHLFLLFESLFFFIIHERN